MTRPAGRQATVALAVALLAAVVGAGAAPAGAGRGTADRHDAAPAPSSPSAAPVTPGVIPSSIRKQYLSTTPSLGPVTVVEIGSESQDRKLLAATLEGVVNRTQARIYLRGARNDADDQYWLDDYQSRGLIHVVATVDLDTALATFKGEVAGYVEASDAEPWTINTATTVAGVDHAVVATPETAATLDALGIPELADHRGRWTSAIRAYTAVAEQYHAKLRYQGVGIEQPNNDAPRDFFVQQGLLAVYTRPSQPDFDATYKLIETFPSTHPVYGYVSDTGDEEVAAVARLSLTGRFLIASDTTDNLSFHVAVGGATRVVARHPSVAGVAPCTTATVNVVIAISDGDNLVIPEHYDPQPTRFGSSRRGELPIGWGLTPASAILMPAIWDHYASGTTDADELVDIMGEGYSFPSLTPTKLSVPFLVAGARLAATLGLDSRWSLDALVSKPDAPGWPAMAEAAEESGAPPAGLLLNYDRWPGPNWFHSPAGYPVIDSQQATYGDGPAQMAAQIQALVDEPAAQRPRITFLPSTVWNGTYDDLATAMKPLADEGVRFLTPAQAFACLPKAAPPATTTTTATTSTRAIGSTDTTGPATVAPAATGATGIPGRPTFTG